MMTNRGRAEYKSLTQQQSNSLDASGRKPPVELLQTENYECWTIGSREQSFINPKMDRRRHISEYPTRPGCQRVTSVEYCRGELSLESTAVRSSSGKEMGTIVSNTKSGSGYREC